MRRVVSFIVSLIMIFSVISVANAAQIYYDDAWHTYEGNIFNLKVNGETLNCEVPPIVFKDYSVVPARDVFEKLGAEVLWNGEKKEVTINYEKTKIKLTINKITAVRNGYIERMPIAPKIINGKTMIPARYVGESLGFDVEFDSKTDTITINTEKKEPKPETPAPTYDTLLSSYSYSKNDETVTVVFNFSKSGVSYSHFLLKEPSRLVIDTKNTKMGLTIRDAETGYDDVTKIRFGQQTEGLRIVVDLTSETKYKITKSGKKLTLKIGDVTTETTPQKPDEDEETKEPEEPEVPVIPDPPSYAPTRTVCIDAGHGGADPGAIYEDEDGTIWRESNINLGVALKVQKILENNNVKVVMTRKTDETVELTTRAPYANEKQTALFVSIHTNSFAGDVANGIETWGSLELSATYAGVTDKTLAENIQKAVIAKTNANNRGVKDTTTLAVIRGSIMPSVLVEVGFISNPQERELMFTESYREKLAQGIAEGILKTLGQMGL